MSKQTRRTSKMARLGGKNRRRTNVAPAHRMSEGCRSAKSGWFRLALSESATRLEECGGIGRVLGGLGQFCDKGGTLNGGGL